MRRDKFISELKEKYDVNIITVPFAHTNIKVMIFPGNFRIQVPIPYLVPEYLQKAIKKRIEEKLEERREKC